MGENKDLVKQARETDLHNYLSQQGVKLKKDGVQRYRSEEHDSLVFTKNLFVWNSKGLKGNALDYAMKVEGKDFKAAVMALTGQSLDPGGDNNAKRAIAYLCKARGISYNIVEMFIKAARLEEEPAHHNIVFPIYSERGNIVGKELHGTSTHQSFKGFSKGSRRGYGFSISFEDIGDGEYDYLMFFESAIDLMSFTDIKLNQQKKTLTSCLLVSMGGLKPEVVQNTILNFGCLKNVILCVDNDAAGESFIVARKKELGDDCKVNRPDKRYKDWNDQLRGVLMDSL